MAPHRCSTRRRSGARRRPGICRRAGAGAVLALAALLAAPGSPAAHADSAASWDWDAVAACESGGNWSADTGNGAYGGLQFKPATWAANGGSGSPAWASRAEQIRVAENVLRTQGPSAWPKCGAAPALWTLPATGPVNPPAPACASVRPGAVLGLLDLRTLCGVLFAPARR